MSAKRAASTEEGFASSVISTSFASGQAARAASIKAGMQRLGLPVLPSPSHILPVMIGDTHIVPVMVGDPVRAKRISDILLAEYGIYVQPINFPTVPRGTERLRFTPSPVHDAGQIDRLVRAMDALWSRCALNRAHAVA